MNHETNTLHTLASSAASTSTGTALNVSRYRTTATQMVYTDGTPAAKTCVSGAKKVTTVTFPAKAAATAGDYIALTDADGDLWGISLNVAGTDPAPTGAIWATIAAGKKCHVDISACTDAASVAAAVELVFDALTGASTKMVTSTTLGATDFTREKPAVVAADVPKSADDAGAGSITSVQKTAGVASGFAPGTDVITTAAHSFVTGMKLALTINSGSLPTGLTTTNYWVIRTSATQFQLAASYADAIAGTAVDFTDYGDEGKTATFTPATLSATFTLQKSCDGTNWANVASATTFTAAGNTMLEEKDTAYQYLRLVTTLAGGVLNLTATTQGVDR